MAIKDTFIRRPTQFVAFRDNTGGTPLSSTSTTALAIGVTSITLASGTNAKVGPIRINSGEDIELAYITVVVGAVITLARATRRAHPISVVVVEQVAEDIGDVDGDVTITMTKQSTDQFSAMRFLAFTQLQGNVTGSLAAKVLGTTLENFALCAGIPRANIIGAGTSIAAPKVLTTDFSDVDSVNNLSLALVNKRQDGTFTVFEAWGVNMDYTQVSIQLARAQNGAVPMKAMIIGAMAEFDGAPAFTALQTYRAAKGKTFKELSSIGVVSDAAVTATSVATAAVAGATTLLLADASAIVAGDWVNVGLDDQSEIHWVLSKATNTLALKTPLLRAQAVGVRVIKAQRVAFGAVAQGGGTFAIGGSTTPLIVENRTLPIGMQPQNAQASFSYNVMDLQLTSIARALGIPQANIAAGGLLLSEALLSAGIQGIYLEGITQDNTYCILTLWGCTQDLSNFALALGGQNPTQVPYNVKPTSGVQFVQYAA